MKKPIITNSNKLYKKAIKIIPGGSQTFSKGPSQFTNNFAPKYLKKGKCFLNNVQVLSYCLNGFSRKIRKV